CPLRCWLTYLPLARLSCGSSGGESSKGSSQTERHAKPTCKIYIPPIWSPRLQTSQQETNSSPANRQAAAARAPIVVDTIYLIGSAPMTTPVLVLSWLCRSILGAPLRAIPEQDSQLHRRFSKTAALFRTVSRHIC